MLHATCFTFRLGNKCMSICMQSYGKMTLLSCFFCIIIWLLQNFVTSVVFIMYWPLKPPVKQEFLNFDLDFTFIVTTCVQLHTILNSLLNISSYNKYLFDFFKLSISVSNFSTNFRKIIISVWSPVFSKNGMWHGSQIK